MHDFKKALLFCFVLIVLSVAGFSLWSVRAYLPIVGILLLVVLVIVLLLALVWAIEHVYRRFHRFEYRAIDQYGTVARRYNRVEYIAPHLLSPSMPARLVREESMVESHLIEEEEEQMAALPAPLLTFSQLLEQGIIQAALSQGKMVLGYYADNHTLRYGSWLDLYSCGIGGVSGSGKSTTVRFLLFQAMLAKGRFIFVDPHIADEEESLAAQFRLFTGVHQFPPCNAAPKEVLQRVRWLKREFDRRKKTGMKTPFLILVIDEFNAVMRIKEVREELADLLLEIEQESRKFGIFAMLLAQRWSAQDLGGADIRTSLASLLAHRFTDEDQARKLVGSRNGPRCLDLDTGHWLFRDTKGKLNEMVTPETSSEDGARVAQLAGTSIIASIPASRGTSTGPLVLTEAMDTQLADVATTEPVEPGDVARIGEVRALLLERKGQNEIIEALWGVRSSDGRPYRTAVEEYRDILATLAGQGNA